MNRQELRRQIGTSMVQVVAPGATDAQVNWEDVNTLVDAIMPHVDQALTDQRDAIAGAIADYGRQWHNDPSAHGAAKAATAYWCATLAKDYAKGGAS